jgi:hypothetical protein
MKPEKAPTITLGHRWGDKQPDWLYRCTLVTRYEVRPDATVWSTLEQVLGPDGKVVEDFWRLPLDYRPTQGGPRQRPEAGPEGPHHRRPSELAHPSRLDHAQTTSPHNDLASMTIT